MTEGLVRLNWRLYSDYRIEKREHPPGTAGASMYGEGLRDCIVGIGVEREYKATLLQHEIFLDLINSARRPGEAGVLEFVNKWGFLKVGWMEGLEKFLSRRNGFLDFVSGKVSTTFIRELHGFPAGATLGPLDTVLERRRGRPRIILRARNLLQFCVLEYYHAHTTGGIDLTACAACGEFLPLHKQGRPKRYCDDACKMMAYRTTHRDAINRKRRQNRTASENQKTPLRARVKRLA